MRLEMRCRVSDAKRGKRGAANDSTAEEKVDSGENCVKEIKRKWSD